MSSRISAFVLTLVAATSVPASAGADTWGFPAVAEVSSPQATSRLTVIPKRDFGIASVGPIGILEKRLDSGAYQVEWVANLVNARTPVDAAVADSGAFAVTLDDYGHAGYGDHTVVVYGSEGQVRHELSLSDFMTEDEIASLPRSWSSIWWRCDRPRIQEPNLLILAVTTTTDGERGCGAIALNLQSGKSKHLAEAPTGPFPVEEAPSAASPTSAGFFRMPEWMKKKLDEEIAASPPLIRAIRDGGDDVAQKVERLLEEGADPSSLDPSGDSALRWSMGLGERDVALLLLRHGANPAANIDEWDGPLGTAIMNDDAELVQIMLKAGVDPNQVADKSRLLMTAVDFGAHEVAKALVAAGADPNLASDVRHETPLRSALANEDWKAKEILMQAGAKPANLPPDLELRWAIEQGNLAGAKAAYTRKREFDPEDQVPERALARAAELGHAEIVEFLVGSGIDPDSRSGLFGTTPLIEAAKAGHLTTAKSLLALGAGINAPDAYGYTPLDVAVLFDRQSVVQDLRIAGAKEGNEASRFPRTWAATSR